MRVSVYGAGAVKSAAPYLGGTLASRSLGAPPPLGRWDRARLKDVREGTWARPLLKIVERAGIATPLRGSPGVRAGLWNTYAVSCVPYPAQLCIPSAATLRRIVQAVRRLVPTAPWAPNLVGPGMGWSGMACGALTGRERLREWERDTDSYITLLNLRTLS